MSDILYPSANLTLLADNKNLMREASINAEVMFIKFNYLPALYDQFHHMVGGVSTSGQVLRDTALTAKLDLEKNIKEMDYLHATSTGPNAEIETDDIALALANLPTKVKSKIRDIITLLSLQISSIKTPLNRSTTQNFLQDSIKSHAEAEAALGLLTEDKIKFQNQRQTLTTAIDALSAGGIEKIGNDIILTLEKVTSLGLAPTKIQLVMFAIEQLKKTIKLIGEGIRFRDLVQQRDELAMQLTAISKSSLARNKQIISLKGQVDFITIIHSIDDQRDIYTGEYQRIIDAFQLFSLQIDKDFKANARQFIQFLSPISRPW